MTTMQKLMCGLVFVLGSSLAVCRSAGGDAPASAVDLQKLATQAQQAFQSKNYPEAIRLMEQVLAKTPHPLLEYNLACAYALTSNTTNALTHLDKAVSLGMNNVTHIENDPDLASVRRSPQFAAIIQKGRAQAELQAKALANVPEPKPIFLPAKGTKPEQVTPLLVFLHGMGSSPEDVKAAFEPLTSAWQYAVLLPCGSVKLGMRPDGKPAYNWDPKKDTEAIVAAIKGLKGIQPDRIFLAGFSAGGSMAYVVALNSPGVLAGAIVFSGAVQEDLLPTKAALPATPKTPFYIVHGRQDPVMPLVLGQNAKVYLEKRGFRVKFQQVEGGHSLPGNYLDLLKDAMQWSAVTNAE